MNKSLIPTAHKLLEIYFSKPLMIQQVECLSEIDRRNVILRIHFQTVEKSAPLTAILKQSIQEEDEDDKDAYSRFARDWAGLEFLSGFVAFGHIIPKFYGGSRALRFILQEDLGSQHVSLVDTLTAANKSEAVAALQRYMIALGRMHAASFGHVQNYKTLLTSIDKNIGNEQEEYQSLLETLYRQELTRAIPAANDDDLYQEAYVLACGFWVLQQTLHHIPTVLENDRIGPSGPTSSGSLWKPEENTVRPRVLARLSAFIDVAEEAKQLPHLLDMAKTMLIRLEHRWQNTLALELYPAFRG